MKLHKLKLTQPDFNQVKYTHEKNFEITLNNRNFQKGDLLLLLEYDTNKELYSGDGYFTEIRYVFNGLVGLHLEYFLLGFTSICLDKDGEDLLNCDLDYKEFINCNESECLDLLLKVMGSKNVGCYEKSKYYLAILLRKELVRLKNIQKLKQNEAKIKCEEWSAFDLTNEEIQFLTGVDVTNIGTGTLSSNIGTGTLSSYTVRNVFPK